LVSSNCGGDFGLHLKRAGYDGLVISGKSKDKVYIHVSETDIKLRDAKKLWGKNTGKTQEMMGSGGKLVIGPAGENLVRYACVVSEERVAGRGGVGAVFGYKQLKGIVAEGNRRITMPNSEKFKKFNKKWITSLRKHVLTGEQLPTFGTAGLVSMMQYSSLLATKNYSSGRFDKFENISGETLREKHLIKNKGCVTCPIQCGRVVKVDGREVKGPELETLGLLGSNLMNDDLPRIMRLNYLCDEYGMDTISFGSSVGFAMELNEKGLWKNGLRFGQCEGLEKLAGLVARREGLGKELAEGTKRMSEKWGGKEFAIQVKGMETAAYEPRAAQGMGLGYATANRGGCHLNGGYLVVLEGLGMRVSGRTTRGKAALTVFFQDLMEAASAGGSCLFTTYAVLPSPLVKYPNNIFVRMVYALMPSFGGLVAFLHNNTGLLGINMPGTVPYPYAYKLVTGRKMNIGQFVRAGERMYNLERLINIRQGMVDGDVLPARLTDELQIDGDKKSRVQLAPMLKKYYSVRGWDKHGVPKKKRLKKLGLI
jgi:aldehyde:ferredoxin oxidoreductase